MSSSMRSRALLIAISLLVLPIVQSQMPVPALATSRAEVSGEEAYVVRLTELMSQARGSGPVTVVQTHVDLGPAATYWTLTDGAGEFFGFRFASPRPILGMMTMKPGLARVRAWQLAADDPAASVAKTRRFTVDTRSLASYLEFSNKLSTDGSRATLTGGPSSSAALTRSMSMGAEGCSLVGLVIGLVVPTSICDLFTYCSVVKGSTEIAICAAERGMAMGSGSWDPGGGIGAESKYWSYQDQCCNRPYMAVADYGFQAKSCHPKDYDGTVIRRTCHEFVPSCACLVPRTVRWDNFIFWPNGNEELFSYSCQCTIFKPQNILRSQDVPGGPATQPRYYTMGIGIMEDFDGFVNWFPTGALFRTYSYKTG